MEHDVVRVATISFYALAGPTLIWPKIPSKTKKRIWPTYKRKNRKGNLVIGQEKV